MKFQILRMQKMKSKVSILRSMKHSFREQKTPNANEKLSHENTHIGADNSQEAFQNFKDRLPPKVRKNGVLALEFLITASPEILNNSPRNDQDTYFKAALDWLKDKHGAENVVYVGIHRDETTPHMYAYVVPLDSRGKLNCRSFYGERNALSQMQDDFHQKVSRRFGMERGVKGSKAKHTRIKEFYSNLEKAENGIELTAEDCKPQPIDRMFGITFTHETNEAVVNRINRKIQPLNELANALDLEKRKRREAELSRDSLSKSNQKMRESVRGIPDKDIAELKLKKELEVQKERALKKAKRLSRRGWSR